MSNVYYDPKDFGLSIVGSVDFSSGSYEFDYTVVWRNEAGELFYADDSGCSCPVPFELFNLEDLIPATLSDIQEHLEIRLEDQYYDYRRDENRMDVVDLLGLIRNGQN